MIERISNRRIIIIGGHELGCLFTEHLVLQGYCVALVIGRADDDGSDGIFPSLVKVAREHDIPTVLPVDINSESFLKVVKDANADIVFSLHNNKIFKNKWIEQFNSKLGIVNAHYAPLPRYGGYWPEVWAIWNNEKDYGTSLHYVDGGVDTGNIIAQYPVAISNTDTRRTLHEKCTQVTFQMLKDHIDSLLAFKVDGREQDASAKTYNGRGLPNNGFVDLSWDGAKIERFFRAISFYPFVGPKIRIGDRVISSVDEDLPFFKPILFQELEYQRSRKADKSAKKSDHNTLTI